MSGLNARVMQLETLGRMEHFDSEGGGRITRVIYCEPYTAHKRVVTALKGTIFPAAGGAWDRKKPHADPLYPWFYCSDVQVEPMHPSAVRGSPSKGFDSGANDAILGQLPAIQAALNELDDFDGASSIDNLTLPEIAAGGIQYAGAGDTQALNTGERVPINTFASRGRCGAKITATYSPLIFQGGLSAAVDPFDYVDPQWEPLTISTQTGRTLYFYSPPAGNPAGLGTLHPGLQDTYALPEIVWRFSIRRLMVPFIPAKTIAMFANKVNKATMILGNLQFPPGTVRMETPEVMTRRGPDGNIWHDVLLKFLIRRLYDERWIEGTGFEAGWVGWNWAYGIPGSNLLQDNLFRDRSSYYPVAWNGGPFQFFGDNHPLFIHDTDADLGLIDFGAGLGKALDLAPFKAGFREGQ